MKSMKWKIFKFSQLQIVVRDMVNINCQLHHILNNKLLVCINLTVLHFKCYCTCTHWTKLTHRSNISHPSDLPGETLQHEESSEQQQYPSNWWHSFWTVSSASSTDSHQGQNGWYVCILVRTAAHPVLVQCTATFHVLQSVLVQLETHSAVLKQNNNSVSLHI